LLNENRSPKAGLIFGFPGVALRVSGDFQPENTRDGIVAVWGAATAVA
jgi:hypothetical protein